MGMQVTVKGLDRLERRLKGLQGPPMHRVAKRALVAGGRKVVPTMAAYAPVGRDTLALTTKKSAKQAGARPLRYSMSSRQGKVGIAAVVGPRAKLAPHRHLVARGTRPHIIRGRGGGPISFGGVVREFVRHPGARSNDYITRAWNAKRAEALAEAARFLVRESER